VAARWSEIWTNAHVATMEGDGYGLIARGAVAIAGDRIAWVGCADDLPPEAADIELVRDLAGALVTPGLVDPHTHIVHAGTRSAEYELRLNGATRDEILAAGGGVRTTVDATRHADDEALLALSVARAWRAIRSGVTTLESKSGYGLDLQTELRMMRISRQMGRTLPLTVLSTFLGAHAVGPEFADDRDRYIDFLCNEVLPSAISEELVDAVDAFCDFNGFSHEQVERLFAVARRHDLPVKLHADQYSDFGAGALGARHGALSVDHLECASAATIAEMARHGTVATLLPGVAWTLGMKARPPVSAMRDMGVPIALATNCNPGSSPTTAPTTIMNIACHLFGLTPVEALAGFTRNAARALGLADRIGTITAGKAADLAIWDVQHPTDLVSHFGENHCIGVMRQGASVTHHPQWLPPSHPSLS
jgi:imidazolonepropionase